MSSAGICQRSHSKIGEYCVFILAKECGYCLIVRGVWGALVCLIVLGRVLRLVNVHRGSSACIPPVHMSVVVGVVLCVGTLSCCSICFDWTVVRIDRRGSMSAYIMLTRVGVNLHGLECMCQNWGKVRVHINGFMCTYVIWVCSKCAYLAGGEILNFECLP